MAFLVVKIGNTSSVAALYVAGRIFRCTRLLREGQSATKIRAGLRSTVGRYRVERAAVCSVVPALTQAWVSAAAKMTGGDVLQVSPELDLGVPLRHYPQPRTLGTDRLANLAALAARGQFPVIVIDFGTATVFDVINSKGEFIGGIIAPGLPMMTEYLAQRTAQLPQIQAGLAVGDLGRSTRSAMQIGVTVGYRGLVREIMAHLKRIPETFPVQVCATGGYAGQALKSLHLKCDRDPHLTLRGIGKILELNPSTVRRKL